MRPLLLLILVFASFAGRAQVVKGTVTDSATRRPVAGASVYFSNTAIGTVTDGNGNFSITSPGNGTFDLVISFIGYAPFRYAIAGGNPVSSLHVILKPRVAVLADVVLLPSDKFGWEKWGSLFKETFIGTSLFSEETELLNSEVLRFHFDKKTNSLTATATDRLHLRNNALGYDIQYDLTKFVLDTLSKEFFFQGYPFFQEIKTRREAVQRQWVKNREEAYRGSLMHFYRSLYDTTLFANGFEVRRWTFLPMAEKKRVKKLYDEYTDFKKSDHNVVGTNPYRHIENTDSVNYFNKVLSTPGDGPMLLDRLLPADSITYRADSATIWLQFPGELEVRYKPRTWPVEYGRSYYDMLNNRRILNLPNRPVVSNIYMKAEHPVLVYANGAYSGGENLVTSDYWSWWEKVGNMLPYEYREQIIIKN